MYVHMQTPLTPVPLVSRVSLNTFLLRVKHHAKCFINIVLFPLKLYYSNSHTELILQTDFESTLSNLKKNQTESVSSNTHKCIGRTSDAYQRFVMKNTSESIKIS